MKPLLRVLLVTFAMSLLAAAYSIRAVRSFQESHSPWDQSCEQQNEEAESRGEPVLPLDQQRVCWTDPNAEHRWEILGQ